MRGVAAVTPAKYAYDIQKVTTVLVNFLEKLEKNEIEEINYK